MKCRSIACAKNNQYSGCRGEASVGIAAKLQAPRLRRQGNNVRINAITT